MATKPQARVGTILEIPLASGSYGYGHFVYRDPQKGPLLSVYDYVSDTRPSLEFLSTRLPMFPPVFAGMRAIVREGIWRVIGRLPVNGFTYPGFLWTNLILASIGFNPARPHWRYWNGEVYTELGPKIPRAYADKEILVVMGYGHIADRIETGKKWYADLIAANLADQ